ncbi:hypothetical protein ACTMTJ_34850 [Phytohabitans sp. LJ34]|uniref:hypothetical protein n=1 Tax=Phytohabitans sp. LJ34 TaxID=3452217 RepID=UPI003F892BD7
MTIFDLFSATEGHDGHRRASGLTAVVCLPPGSSDNPAAVTAAVQSRLPALVHPQIDLRLSETAYLSRTGLTAREHRQLVGAGAVVDGRVGCAGGPIGLLDLPATREVAAAAARQLWQRHHSVVAGTPPAAPWSQFADRNEADPDHYPYATAVCEFTAQPRIATMLAHDEFTTDPDDTFTLDDYGPGLAAYDDGPAAYADYRAGVLLYGDVLIGVNGRPVTPTGQLLPCTSHTWPQRQAYHQLAAAHLADCEPGTVLLSVTVQGSENF